MTVLHLIRQALVQRVAALLESRQCIRLHVQNLFQQFMTPLPGQPRLSPYFRHLRDRKPNSCHDEQSLDQLRLSIEERTSKTL
jgi:hypothetical protein